MAGPNLEQWWSEHGGPINVLLAYAFGILVYGLAVNALYQVLSHRVMLGRKEGQTRVATPGRRFLYFLLFPLVSFTFFLILAAALLFMSSGSTSATTIFTIAMAVVMAVRIAAYFSEATSHDLAKTLPLGLLGVFLVIGDVKSLTDSLQRLWQIVDEWPTIATFFIIVVAVEFLLRGYRAVLVSMRRKRPPAEAPSPPAGR